ncbi:hypothetical protein ETAA8_00620 [Anatilimnocola aggregata]|uniref:Uncharacterized protein n=1 Tax=Anatilimnocola aggregata TaxID=2528021 RepID=A0A517Y412_9BACT|nr:hypothetical protein [Anatilimnocola aggregata]QDU25001.1 hypothetical protein ETAA8_00620 [Anatilimnocola aggregata]
MNQQLTITREFHINRRHHGRKQFRDGMAPDVPVGRVPRIARLMALALRCERLIRDGVMTDQSELARFRQITTSRMTQIMSLLNLAPDLQEQILFLPRNERGRKGSRHPADRQNTRLAQAAAALRQRLGEVETSWR